MKVPADLQTMCDDLKVCGRAEFAKLIRLRHKYENILKRRAQAAVDEEVAKAKAAEEPEDEDARIDRELEETMKRVEKEKKRQAKKEKVLNDKSELRKKMSVIATTTLDNDEDLLMSRKLWDSVRDKGFDAAGEKSEESSDSDEERKALRESDDSEDEDEDEESSSGDELPDEKQAQIAARKARRAGLPQMAGSSGDEPRSQ